MPKVSIVVNTVDRPQDLNCCLTSILNQTYRDFEVVVVNNGTGSETLELLQVFADKFRGSGVEFKVVNDLTKKLSYLFNLGFKSTNRESTYIAYIADDAEAYKDWLENAIKYLESDTKCGAVSGPMLSTANPPGEMFYLRDLASKNIFTKIFLRIYEYFVMEDKTMEPGYWPQSGAFSMGAGIPLPHIKNPIEIDLLTSGNMVATRICMERVGGFDENFYFNHADGDLFIRMKKAGYKMVFHPNVTVLHHMRFGPTRYPWFLGRDTSFYYLKDVRPHSIRGFIGASLNLFVFNSYFIFKGLQLKRVNYIRGITGFIHGIYDFFTRNTPERNELIKKLAVFTGFIGLFAYAYKDFWGYGMLAYGDATPFPNDFTQALRSLVSGWDPRVPDLQVVPQITVLYSFLPIEILLIVLSGGNSINAQRIFHYGALPLSFVAIYFFVSKFTGSRFARFLAAFVYSANLFMVAEFLGGYEGNLYIQALLPVLLMLIYKVYRMERFYFNTFLYTLVLSFAFILSDHIFIFLAPFILLLIVLFMRKYWITKDKGLLKRLFFFLIFSHLFIFIVTFYHSFSYLKSATPFLTGGKVPAEVLQFLKRNVDDTYRQYTLGSAIRAGGGYFTKDRYDIFPYGYLWARTGFILPILAFGWVIFRENRSGKKFYLALFLTILAIIDLTFINFVRGERLSWLYNALPFLFRFRNPSRPTLFLLFTYVPLVAITFDSLILRAFVLLKRRSVNAFIYSVFVVGSVVLLTYYFRPFFNGDLTFVKNRGGNSSTITENYLDFGKYLSEKRTKEGIFRTFVVPWDHESAEVKLYWVEPFAYAVPVNYGAYAPNSKYLSDMKGFYEDLQKKRNLNLGKDLSVLGVKYVAVNFNSKDKSPALFTFDYQSPWLLGSPMSYQKIIEDLSFLEYSETIGNFRIYKNLDYNESSVNMQKAGLISPSAEKGQLLKLTISAVSLVALLVLLRYSASRSL